MSSHKRRRLAGRSAAVSAASCCACCCCTACTVDVTGQLAAGLKLQHSGSVLHTCQCLALMELQAALLASTHSVETGRWAARNCKGQAAQPQAGHTKATAGTACPPGRWCCPGAGGPRGSRRSGGAPPQRPCPRCWQHPPCAGLLLWPPPQLRQRPPLRVCVGCAMQPLHSCLAMPQACMPMTWVVMCLYRQHAMATVLMAQLEAASTVSSSQWACHPLC